MNNILKMILIVSGTLCVCLGVLGMFLPLLPATPFLLLAAFFYARSSRRFYTRLMTNHFCGEYISNYRQGRGMTARHKALVLFLLWPTIGFSAFFAVSSWWIRNLLIIIAAGVTIHIARIRTWKKEHRRKSRIPECDPVEETL